MTAHLLALTVGPVQDFIAAARRTRDLWFGSELLSEISRAVAREVERHGQLIFPASTKAPNVANVILAELRTGEDPAAVALLARQAAQATWRKSFADPVFEQCRSVIRPDIWAEQVEDVIEFYAAWVPRTGSYREDRARVMRLLGGRKNCRDFLAAKGRPGVPKSSLDGMREGVLKHPDEWRERDRHRMRVRAGEQLDVIGLVKRVAEGSQPYPSVARVAADPWLRARHGRLQEVLAACRQLNDRHGSQVIRELNTEAYPHYAEDFPYEGTAVFRSRHYELAQEAELPPDELRPLADAVGRLGEPNPYLAVIVADGDKMGETLSNLSDVRQHREFSAALATFAEEARKIVHEHRGVLVYSGGDDVLAFVPVDQCLDCARALHDRFRGLLKSWGDDLTLSVGVAIAHFMENLEDLREYGFAAEKHAKQPDRNGLAVHLHKRGGSPVQVRASWTDNPDAWLNRLAEWLRKDQLPTRLAADVNRMAEVYEQWHGDPTAAIVGDVLRLIRAKQPGGKSVVREIEAALTARARGAAALRRLAKELLLAREFSTALRQANGPHSGGDM
jgi:CRISPR-associated protein Cmr2